MNSQQNTIITHDGQFHADEVLACGILLEIYPHAKICRSRDPHIISKGDIVVDVGKIYNPLEGKFDHHQAGCDEKYSDEHTIPMSSVGMVYKEYSNLLFNTLYGADIKKNKLDIRTIMDTVYKIFILEIDAVDNGVKQLDKHFMHYTTHSNLSNTISKMNSDDIYNSEIQNAAFYDAMNYAIITLKIHTKSFINKLIGLDRDYKIVSNAMGNRFDNSDTGEIIVIPCDCPNWLYCIRQYENKNSYPDDNHNIKYIIYPNNKDDWRIRSMPGIEQFQNRKNLKGVDEILCSNKYIQNDIIFIHEKKFIGGAKNLLTAIKIAQISLSE